MAEQVVWEYTGGRLSRIRVPGGWLYRSHMSDFMTFVPEPPTVARLEQYIPPRTPAAMRKLKESAIDGLDVR